MDAWSLGCLLHFMAVGTKPVFNAHGKLDKKPLRGVIKVYKVEECRRSIGVGKALADAIQRLLNKSPRRRMTPQVEHTLLAICQGFLLKGLASHTFFCTSER